MTKIPIDIVPFRDRKQALMDEIRKLLAKRSDSPNDIWKRREDGGITVTASNDKIWKLYKDNIPDIWNMFHVKRFRKTEKWGDYRLGIEPLVGAIAAIQMKTWATAVEERGIQETALNAAETVKYGVPVFFVEDELFEAAMRTEPPHEIDWTKIEMPYEAFLLAIPRGKFKFPGWEDKGKFEGDVQVISVGRFWKNQDYKIPGTNVIAKLPDNYFHCSTMVSETREIYKYWLQQPFSMDNRFTHSSNLLDTQADKDFVFKMTAVCLNLILAMSARPELIESGRVVKQRCKKTGLQICEPNIIGRKYRYKTEHQGGTHASPVFHWRKGHFRVQGFGKPFVEPLCKDCKHDTKKHFNGKHECREEGCECTVFKKQYDFPNHRTIWLDPIQVFPRS